MFIQGHINRKLIKKVLGGHGWKWAWSVWSRDSEMDCISRMNQWNEQIFCMLVQIRQVISMIFRWAWSEMGMAI